MENTVNIEPKNLIEGVATKLEYERKDGNFNYNLLSANNGILSGGIVGIGDETDEEILNYLSISLGIVLI